jgi:hypothetical protein
MKSERSLRARPHPIEEGRSEGRTVNDDLQPRMTVNAYITHFTAWGTPRSRP